MSTSSHTQSTSQAPQPASPSAKPKRHVGRIIAAGIVACLALAAGIAWGWFNRGVTIIARIDLDRTVGVAYFAPQRGSFLPWERTGILAFVYGDGSYHLVDADALDGAQPVWTRDGLFIPGNRHTQLITASGGQTNAVTQNAASSIQGLGMTADLDLDSGRFEAYSSGTAQSTVVLTTYATGTANATTSHASGTLGTSGSNDTSTLGYAACGDDVYALVRETPSDAGSTNGGASNGSATDTLLHVASNGALLDRHGTALPDDAAASASATQASSTVTTDTTAPDTVATELGEALFDDTTASQAPTALASTASCNAGVFSILMVQTPASQSNNNTVALWLDSWDTAAHRHTTTPLSRSGTAAFTLATGDVPTATATGGTAVSDGALYWYTASRRLLRTDLTTGRTSEVNGAKAFTDGAADHALATWFGDGDATAFSTAPGASGSARDDAELVTVNMSTGGVRRALIVKGVNKRVKQFNPTMTLQSFAANPSYHGTQGE